MNKRTVKEPSSWWGVPKKKKRKCHTTMWPDDFTQHCNARRDLLLLTQTGGWGGKNYQVRALPGIKWKEINKRSNWEENIGSVSCNVMCKVGNTALSALTHK